MSYAATKVMTTVNAPYGALVDSEQLAQKLVDPQSASSFDCSAFAFFSEVSPKLQDEFILEMGIDKAAAVEVAKQFSASAGYELPLCA